MKEEAKAIETLKKDLEIQGRKVKVVEVNLKRSQEELELFQVGALPNFAETHICVLEAKTTKTKHRYEYSDLVVTPIAEHH